MKKSAIALFVLLLGYVVYVLFETGFFRTIQNRFDGQFMASIPISGVEDITVDEDDEFAIFIAYDRAAERDGTPTNGAIYFMDLSNNLFEPKEISHSFNRPLLPHGISLIQLDSNHHRLFVINHVQGEAIEVFDLFHRDSLVHRQTLTDPLIYSPNDIVATGPDQFYFTNDTYSSSQLGKLAENYLGLGWCETVYCNGSTYRVVNDGLSYANGINYDSARNLVYVAAVRQSTISVFNRLANGDLELVETINCGTGVDNIEIDRHGDLWVGCHPNMLLANEFIKGNRETAPSEIIRIRYRKPGDYDIESIYLNDGTEVSASTVSANYQDLMLVGNVCDDHFVVLQRNQ